MKSNRKILFAILGILLIAFVGLIVLKVTNSSDENNNVDNKREEVVNQSAGVISRKEVSNVVFDNISYVYDGEKTTVKLEITNNNDKSIKLGLFIVNVYDENNEIMDTFAPVSKNVIAVGEKKELEFSLDKDLSQAERIEFELPNLEIVEEE